MRRARRLARAGLGVLAALAVLVAPRPAVAWNATGHVSIAWLAYEALPPAQRAALVRLLGAHPRLEQDLQAALPAALPSGAARDRWLFALAGTWPDLARGQPDYDHATWHYVNLPLGLRRGRLASCEQARAELAASERRVAEVDTARRAQGLPGTPRGDSLRVALPDNARTLADAGAPRAARALALSWVLHLVADAHQPLHAVALFTPDRFLTGDRGGNDILVRERGPLHRVWDDLLGTELAPEPLEAVLRELRRGARPPGARTPPQELASRVDQWLAEGCELARRAVYAPAVLRAVERFEARPVGDKPELALPPEYLRQAGRHARERARLAAARLAALLADVPP